VVASSPSVDICRLDFWNCCWEKVFLMVLKRDAWAWAWACAWGALIVVTSVVGAFNVKADE